MQTRRVGTLGNAWLVVPFVGTALGVGQGTAGKFVVPVSFRDVLFV